MEQTKVILKRNPGQFPTFQRAYNGVTWIGREDVVFPVPARGAVARCYLGDAYAGKRLDLIDVTADGDVVALLYEGDARDDIGWDIREVAQPIPFEDDAATGQ